MADAPPPKRGMGNMGTILLLVGVSYLLFNPSLRNALGAAAGYVLDPVIGFGGRFPVLTIMLAGTVMVLASTAIRHFTTDWIDQARTSAYMREFQKEMAKARKDNNTYRLKKLQDKQPEVLQKQAEMSKAQFKTMPYTMIVVVPLFAWLFTFASRLDYWFFSTPWNPSVDMFSTSGFVPTFGGGSTSVFPHWVLLYMALSIPLGSLVSRAMKYLAWRERWRKSHPGAAG